MGNIIYHKGILLDERDLHAPLYATIEALSAPIDDLLQDAFDPGGDLDSGRPFLEIYGLASERFAATHFYDDPRWSAGNWLEIGGDFCSALMREIRHLDLPDPNAVLREDSAALQALEPWFQQRICARVTRREYGAAAQLISDLPETTDGLPGVRPRHCFNWDSDEAIFDFRQTRHGAGTRMLAEIGFNWGQ